MMHEITIHSVYTQFIFRVVSVKAIPSISCTQAFKKKRDEASREYKPRKLAERDEKLRLSRPSHNHVVVIIIVYLCFKCPRLVVS